MAKKLNWPLRRLGNLADFRNGVNYNKSSFGHGIKVVGVSNFKDYTKPRYLELEQINPDGIVTERNILRDGDVVFVRSNGNRELIGRSLFIETPPEEVTHSAFTIRLRFTSAEVHPKFYAYYFRTPLIRQALTAQGGGTNINNLNQDILNALEVPVPPLLIQQRIAGILSAYDDLIENSQRRIKILESMARALYREWFVNFRFPGHEGHPRVASPLGEIPKGWEVTTVADAFVISGGGTPSRKEDQFWESGTIQWYSPSDLTGAGTMFMDDSGDHITETGLVQSSARMFPARCVMLTSRATIGAIAINTHPACTNQGFITCFPNDRVPLYFLFHWVTENVPTFQRMASGATFKEISRGVFKTIGFIHPPENLVRCFEESVMPMAEQILALQRQVQNLRRTRDLLLPRLLSGQIEVSVELLEADCIPALERTTPPARLGTSPVLVAAAPEAPAPLPQPVRAAPAPARGNLDPEALLVAIRQLFGDGLARDHNTALRDLAQSLGCQRLGKRIKEGLSSALLTAVRRGILTSYRSEYTLNFRSLEECDRNFLKADFLSSLGRAWTPRTEAIQAFARYLGFARVGHVIDDTARSLINGLIREGRLETDGPDHIRRT